MSFITTFQRYEQRYLVSNSQLEHIMGAVTSNMEPDKYPISDIRNIYCDTDNYLLIRRSIEKPIYTEKLRLRSYGKPMANGMIFVEMKKNFKKVVYKRRLTNPIADTLDWLTGDGKLPDTQIGREIGFMRDRYPGIKPKMVITYDRESYCKGDFRLTID